MVVYRVFSCTRCGFSTGSSVMVMRARPSSMRTLSIQRNVSTVEVPLFLIHWMGALASSSIFLRTCLYSAPLCGSMPVILIKS